MHNNAIGPEICGKPQESRERLLSARRYVDRATGQLAAGRQAARVLGVRPERRGPLQALCRIDGGAAQPGRARHPEDAHRSSTSTCRSTIGLRAVGRQARSRWSACTIVVPKGSQRRAARRTSSTRQFIDDLFALKREPDALEQRLGKKQLGPDERQGDRRRLRTVARTLMRSPEKLVETLRKHPKLLRAYRRACGDRERRPPLRRRPARGRQEGADRFPRHPLTDANHDPRSRRHPSPPGAAGGDRPCAAAPRLRLDERVAPPDAGDQVRAGGGRYRLKKPDLAQVEYEYPLHTRRAAEAHAREPRELHPGADRPDLRAPHRGADPRRRVRRRILSSRGESGESPARRDRGRAARARAAAQGHRLDDRRRDAVEGQGVLSRRARAAQPHRGSRAPQARSSKAIRRSRRSRSTARTRGCSFRRSSTAARACSTAAASRSSSTTSSPTRFPATGSKPDFLAGRDGLAVRDEIRMVRPGFYLGRAYLGKVFLLNFTLYNKAIAERDGAGIRADRTCRPRTAGPARRRVRRSQPSDAMAGRMGDAGRMAGDHALPARRRRPIRGAGATGGVAGADVR